MEIICSTTYDRRALSALARALRKTVRRTRSRLLRVWCWVLLVLSLLSAWVSWGEWGTVALNGAVAVLMLAVLLGEDAINAFFARRNALPGMEVCTVRFLEEHYETKIAGAATQWQYSKLLRLAENDRLPGAHSGKEPRPALRQGGADRRRPGGAARFPGAKDGADG